MSDLANSLSSKTGIDPELVQKGLGSLLAFLKEHFGGDILNKVQAAIPNAHELLSAAESEKGSSGGGFLETISSLAGKLFGGHSKEAAALLSGFNKAGFSAEQVAAFLPHALELIQKHLPPEVFEKIKALLPAAATAAPAEK
jgi:hypothetical protein